MAGTRGQGVKLLFVLSNDFGELANALELVAGTALETVLLMPDRLWQTNRDLAGTHSYRGLADLIKAIDQQRPEVVFLFSGYLYAINQLLEVADVAALLQALKERHCRIVTSDPFLG